MANSHCLNVRFKSTNKTTPGIKSSRALSQITRSDTPIIGTSGHYGCQKSHKFVMLTKQTKKFNLVFGYLFFESVNVFVFDGIGAHLLLCIFDESLQSVNVLVVSILDLYRLLQNCLLLLRLVFQHGELVRMIQNFAKTRFLGRL